MIQSVLVVIKPDGLSKQLVGNIFTRFSKAELEIVGVKMLRVSRELAEEHYKHIKSKPFYAEVIDHLMGKLHKQKNVIAVIYRGENAINRCRKICGATNPEEAEPSSIRGAYGRITTKGLFENILHVSDSPKESLREIQLWFDPDEVMAKLYPTKDIEIESVKKRVWA